MKLTKITINEPFRGLFQGFQVCFREDEPNTSWEAFHPFCFAGLNGSGKSNVLEALANIFFHLECCTLNVEYSDFLKHDFNKIKSEPASYELEYYIIPKGSNNNGIENFVKVIIKKDRNHIPQIAVIALDQGQIKFEEVSPSIRTYLPELVIGYSSGENEIISLPFIKSRLLQFDEYIKFLNDKKKYEVEYNLELKPESSLIYMDYHMSQAILLANFLLQNEDSLAPIKNQLDIDKIHSFRLVINNHKLYNEEDYPDLGYLKILADDFITKLRNCATARYLENDKNGDNKFEYLDYIIEDATKNAFKDHFGTPLQLFRAFQVLTMLNLRVVDKRLKSEIYNSDSLYAMYKIPVLKEEEHLFHFNLFKIKKKNSVEKMLLKAFSDGEHQFLHTMGICLMLQNKSALFLLDEPETHFNPEWRSEFVSVMKESLDKSGINHLMRDIIITSHSPFIISDCYPDKVIIFKKNIQPKNANTLGIPTFGTSINILSNKIYGKKNTIGNHALDKIEEFRKRFRLGIDDIEAFKEEINEELGDSIEKLLLIKEVQTVIKKHKND